MKNHRVTHEKNEYILFDDVEQLQTKTITTPEKANKLLDCFEMLAVSPLGAHHMMNFKEVEKGLFYPLPF
jgi:hypothetical protein